MEKFINLPSIREKVFKIGFNEGKNNFRAKYSLNITFFITLNLKTIDLFGMK